MSSSRSTVSTDPTTSSSAYSGDEEKVRSILRELRQKNVNLEHDILQLEKALTEPAYNKIVEKIYACSTAIKNNATTTSSLPTLPETKDPDEDDDNAVLVDRCKKFITPKVSWMVKKKTQKLAFGLVDIATNRPEIYVCPGQPTTLSIVGPKDLRKRTGGVLRIADQVVSLDYILVSELIGDFAKEQPSICSSCVPVDGAPCSKVAGDALQGQPPSNVSSLASVIKSRFNDYLDTKAAAVDTGGSGLLSCYLVVGVLRQIFTKSMALTSEWTQVEIVHLPNNPSQGLGFGIVGGASTGVVIKTILPGSLADRLEEGRLLPCDRILQIGRINVQGMSSQQVAALLRPGQSEPFIQLIVGRPIQLQDTVIDTPFCWTMATRSALCPATLDEQVRSRIQCTPSPCLPSTSLPPVLGNGTLPHQHLHNHVSPTNITTTTVEDGQPQHTATSSSPPKEVPIKQQDTQKQVERSLVEEEEVKGDNANLPGTSCDAVKEGLSLLEKVVDGQQHEGDNDNCTDSIDGDDEHAMNAQTASTSTSSQPVSLRILQEMALTTFCRENWEENKYETIEVELTRNPNIGLGITVAGYVYKKEEINGVFVKSLVPNSSAHLSKSIRVHDLIIQVNEKSLENLSHADSVRTLIKSGDKVRLKMIRFDTDSQQAKCLKMLYEQETATQVDDVQSTLLDYKTYWLNRLGSSEFEIVAVDLRPDNHLEEDGGLGISLEGIVDVVDGHQLCPHHFVESLRPNGPAAKLGVLKSGDELLQVNQTILYGESHVTVQQKLNRAVQAAGDSSSIRLFLCRRVQQVNLYVPSAEQSLPLSYPLLAMMHDEHFVKAKSELTLSTLASDPRYRNTSSLLREVSKKLRSRSLEHLSGLAVWNCVPILVTLDKDAKGLGFSVVDYEDPMHTSESVIVVRSLVPGGAAQADGRIVPGDRLLFVNGEDLSHSNLDRAVAVLKSAPLGPVRLGIAKPVPIDQCCWGGEHSPLISRSERLLAKGSSPRARRRHHPLGAARGGPTGLTPLNYYQQSNSGGSSQEEVWIGADFNKRLNPQLYFPPFSATDSPATPRSHTSMFTWSPCSSRSLSPCGSPNATASLKGSWAYDVVYLPAHLERHIKIVKGSLQMGVVVDADVDNSINGCLVKSICSKKAIGRDGRIQVGDYIVKVNTENLRNVTNSQARAIFKRTNLIGTQCNVTYITSADARLWKQKFQRDSVVEETLSSSVNRLSPKVYPKFYRSPVLDIDKNKFVEPTQAELEAQEDASCSPSLTIASKNLNSTAITTHLPAREQEAEHDVDLNTINSSKLDEETTGGTSNSASTPSTVVASHSNADISAFPTPCQQFLDILLQDAFEEALYEFSRSYERMQREETHRIKSSSVKAEKSKVSAVKKEVVLLPTPAEELLEPSPSSSSPVDSLSSVVYRSVDIAPPAQSPKVNRSSLKGGRREAARIAAAAEVKFQEQQSSKASTSSELAAEQQQEVGCTATDGVKNGSTSSMEHSPLSVKKSNFWCEARTVVLNKRPNETFGISIVGGRVEVSQKGGLPGTGNTVSGIFIKSVMAESPAGRSGKMFMGDRVISVNNTDLRSATHEQAVSAIKNATNPVKFVVQSLQSFLPNQMLSGSNSPDLRRKIELIQESRKLPQRSGGDGDSNKESTSSVGDQPPLEEVASSTARLSNNVEGGWKEQYAATVIEPESAAALAKTSTDGEQEDTFFYTKEKISRKYGSLPGEKILIRLENIPPKGLGFSLAGGSGDVTEEGGAEEHKESNNVSSTPIIVVDIKSTSPLPLQVGDELLEINAKVLFGLTHSKASDKIRNCCEDNELALLILRSPVLDPPSSGAATSGDDLQPGDDDGLDELSGETNKSDTSQTEAVVEVETNVLKEEMSTVEVVVVEEVENKQIDETDLEEGTACCSSNDTNNNSEDAPPPSTSQTPLMQLSLNQMPVTNITLQPANPSPAPSSSTDVRKKSWQHQQQQLQQQQSVVADMGERTVAIETGKETWIEIDKEGKGLGLSIVGGSDTVLGTVVIHEVYPDGAAAVDARLKPGDQVLEVNNTSLRGISHEQAISLLRRTPPKVRLLIYRDVNLQLSLLDPTQIYNCLSVELTKKPGRGLGISIVGRKNEPGVYISEIVKGGVAEADARLMQGDQILAVNGQDVTSSMQEDVATILKTCTGKVTLKVGRWKLTETANRVHAAQPPTLNAHNQQPLPLQQQQNLDSGVASGSNSSSSSQQVVGNDNNVITNGNHHHHRTPPTATPAAGSSRGESGVVRATVPPPPAPYISGGKIPLQITVQDENQAVIRPDLSPVSEEDLKSIAETTASEETHTGSVSTSGHSSQQRRPPSQAQQAQTPKISLSPATAAKYAKAAEAATKTTLRADLVEEGSESLLIQLRKDEGCQWGMGIGKRQRGILITSLQPGSTAAEHLAVGDRIMGVNGEEVTDQLSAVTLVRDSGNVVALQIARQKHVLNK